MELGKVRFLDSVESVNRWVAINRETVGAHFSVISFMKRWLGYTRDVLDYYADRELPMVPPQPELSMEKITELVSSIENDGDHALLQIEMDYLLSSLDMARLRWPGQMLWMCAVFLIKEGRAQEAVSMMEAAAAQFDNTTMPDEEIVSFLKDYARVLSSRDLCHIPRYDYAELILDNAIAKGGVNDEIREIRKSIFEGQVATQRNRAIIVGARGTNVADWLIAKEKSVNAIHDGDIIGALRLMWLAIKDYGVIVANLATPQLEWLASQMEKFFDAIDEPYRSGIDEILNDMAASPEVIGKFPVTYSQRFMKALVDRGLGVTITNTERASEPAVTR
jgi:hypothetical protein